MKSQKVANWTRVLVFVEALPKNRQVEALQGYIQQGGPIPDELDDRARAILGQGAKS